MEGSEGTVSWKTARASRWRSAEDGAVNSKTAGAVKATLCRKKGKWATSPGGTGQCYLRDSMRNDRPINNVPWVFVLRPLLVQARDLEGESKRFWNPHGRRRYYRVTNAVTQMNPGIPKSNTGERSSQTICDEVRRRIVRRKERL